MNNRKLTGYKNYDLNKKTILATVYLSASLMSLSVWANCNSIICNGTIEQLFIQDGRLLIATSGDERSLNCDAVSQRYMSVSRNDPNYDECRKDVGLLIEENRLGRGIRF